MNIKKVSFLLVLALLIGVTAHAQDWQPVSATDVKVNSEIMSSFTNVVRINPVNVTVPTVVEVDFDASSVTGSYFGVYDNNAKSFVASYFINKSADEPRITAVQNTVAGGNVYEIFDNNQSTKKDYYLTSSIPSKVSFAVRYNKPIRTTSFNLQLDKNVTLPDNVTVQALVNNKWVTVINKIRPTGNAVTFPETTALDWDVQIEYSQPIRIIDLSFSNAGSYVSKKSVRFLALPQTSYMIYANPQRKVYSYMDSLETYSLSRLTSARNLGTYVLDNNLFFTETDTDSDGLPDKRDNCKDVPNLDQSDEDSNGIGDLCDDYDRDFVQNYKDNCPSTPNSDQIDTDGDKIGDKCDSDESRLTEKYPAIVWGGIIFAFMIFIVLLLIAAKKIKDQKSNGGNGTTNANIQ